MLFSADRIESLRHLLAQEGIPAMSDEELQRAGISVMRFVLAKYERANELIKKENVHEQDLSLKTNSR